MNESDRDEPAQRIIKRQGCIVCEIVGDDLEFSEIMAPDAAAAALNAAEAADRSAMIIPVSVEIDVAQTCLEFVQVLEQRRAAIRERLEANERERN